MRIPFFRLLILTLALALLTGCNRGPEPITNDKLQITVSIVPQRYFVQRIAGDHVQINVMVSPGNNPATYEPKPEQLKALSKSAAYMSIGVPFESAWLDRILATNQEMLLVDTTAGIKRQALAAHLADAEKDDADKGENLDLKCLAK